MSLTRFYYSITAKYLFTSIVPRILVVECAWCVCMLPFILGEKSSQSEVLEHILTEYLYLVSALVCSGLRDSFRGQAGHVPFEVIHALCWVLTGLCKFRFISDALTIAPSLTSLSILSDNLRIHGHYFSIFHRLPRRRSCLVSRHVRPSRPTSIRCYLAQAP